MKKLYSLLLILALSTGGCASFQADSLISHAPEGQAIPVNLFALPAYMKKKSAEKKARQLAQQKHKLNKKTAARPAQDQKL